MNVWVSTLPSGWFLAPLFSPHPAEKIPGTFSPFTADEAAWLAAILPSPRRYDPIRKTTALTRRHERILTRINRGSTQLEP
jgi:membrane peptidoglycan carboxypeptidase